LLAVIRAVRQGWDRWATYRALVGKTIMQNGNLIYWKVLNILFRVIGVVFIFNGTAVSIYGINSLSDPKVGRLDAWSTTLCPLLVVALGVVLVVAPPFRSKLSSDK
jgi:hypothetical protein